MAANVYMSVAGAGGKTGVDWANAYSSAEAQSAFDDCLGGGAGSNLYIESGTYSVNTDVGADIDLDAGVGTADLNRVIGVNSSTHVEDGSIAVFDGESTLANVFKLDGAVDYTDFRNIEATNATGDAFTHSNAGTSVYIHFYNCAFTNSDVGFDGESINITRGHFDNCEASGNTTNGFKAINGGYQFDNSTIYNNGYGFFGCTDIEMNNSLVYGNTTANFYDAARGGIFNTTVDGTRGGANTTDGFSAGDPDVVTGSRITNHSRYGFNNSQPFSLICTYFYANTTWDVNTGVDYFDGGYNRLSGANSSDGYTDAANGDYTLAKDGDGVGVAVGVGKEDEATNISYRTQGIPPTYASGGVPTFAGYTGAQMCSDGTLRFSFAVPTGATFVLAYISTSAITYANSEVAGAVPSTSTKMTVYQLPSGAPLVAGSLYHFALRAINIAESDVDTNTVTGSYNAKGRAGNPMYIKNVAGM